MTSTLSRRWIAVLATVLGLAVIIGCQLGPNRYRMEDDLARRASGALAAAGQPRIGVSFDGRDAVVSAATLPEADRAREVVASVAGVREVTVRIGTAVNGSERSPERNDSAQAREQAARQNAAAQRARQRLAERQRALAVQKEIDGLASLTFHTGGARLTGESREVLRDVAALLTENAGARVQISGHTDTRGAARANLELSRERAAAVRDALVEYGVEAGRLTARGFGETRPAVPDDTAEHRAQNRRVELVAYS